MDDILSRFSINCHSSIRYAGGVTVWFDPFRVADAPCDADVVFVTHDHYDHFSPEDIRRVMKPGAVLVLPETCVAAALRAGFASAQLLPVRPGEAYTVKDLPFTAVPAYNLSKPFHPRGNRWVGYVVTLEGRRVYVAGDTDDTPDARSVSCDVAFLPVGGTYTMTAAQAAGLAAALRPQIAVPTHYGCIVGERTDGAAFAAALPQCKPPVCYNGDITTTGQLHALEAEFPTLSGIMIGRGIIADPALFRKALGGPAATKAELRGYLDDLYHGYTELFGSAGCAISRMKGHWFYLIHCFADSEKLEKQLKKLREPWEYETVVNQIFTLPLI